MTNYNYFEEMKKDIESYLHENYTKEEIIEKLQDKNDFIDELNDDLFCHDSITGNASGSYTFNSYVAREYVTANTELLKDALECFCVDSETITDKFLNDEYEYFDVTIRCYILSGCVYEVIDELYDEFNI